MGPAALMVVDTSVIIAILNQELDQERLGVAIRAASRRLISAGSVIEASIVALRQASPTARERALVNLDDIIESLGLSIEPVTRAHIELAREAFSKFGKGVHPAGLKFGDCFAYALAKETGKPLLFVGGDFAKTDVALAEW